MSKVSLFGALALVLVSVSLPSGAASNQCYTQGAFARL